MIDESMAWGILLDVSVFRGRVIKNMLGFKYTKTERYETGYL